MRASMESNMVGYAGSELLDRCKGNDDSVVVDVEHMQTVCRLYLDDRYKSSGEFRALINGLDNEFGMIQKFVQWTRENATSNQYRFWRKNPTLLADLYILFAHLSVALKRDPDDSAVKTLLLDGINKLNEMRRIMSKRIRDQDAPFLTQFPDGNALREEDGSVGLLYS